VPAGPSRRHFQRSAASRATARRRLWRSSIRRPAGMAGKQSTSSPTTSLRTGRQPSKRGWQSTLASSCINTPAYSSWLNQGGTPVQQVRARLHCPEYLLFHGRSQAKAPRVTSSSTTRTPHRFYEPTTIRGEESVSLINDSRSQSPSRSLRPRGKRIRRPPHRSRQARPAPRTPRRSWTSRSP
jgi:hypothetical protein